MRRSIVAGNWKMHGQSGAAGELAQAVSRELDGFDDADVVLCPTFTALHVVAEQIAGTGIRLGAQDLHWETEGAFTGEVSADMLRDLGCTHVIVGHSERRTYFGETDATVRRKTLAALDAGLCPIVCIGETLEEREGERTEQVLCAQIENGLADLGTRLSDIVLAYEPVWAIGTGRTASPEQVQTAHAFIRGLAAKLADDGIAASLRIQYGGSVKPANAAELFALPDVDGGLIGGAALQASSFAEIVRAAG